MGGTGLEPVTPSLSTRSSVRTGSDEDRSERVAELSFAGSERSSEHERTSNVAIVATPTDDSRSPPELRFYSRHSTPIRAALADAGVNEERPSHSSSLAAPANVSDPLQVGSRSGPARAHRRAPREIGSRSGQESSPISDTAGDRIR